MTIEVIYKPSVDKDLKKIKKPHNIRIMDKLEEALKENPRKGEAMKGKYKGILKLRIGEYRVLYHLIPEGVEILRIQIRGKEYRN